MKIASFINMACLVSALITTPVILSQNIDSIQVTPSLNPGINDTIKIYIYNTFSSGGCAGTANFSQTGFNIGSNSLHCLGMLSVICQDIDTVILNPPHAQGTYQFVYVLNAGFGGPPCTPGIVPNDFDTAHFTVGSVPPPVDNPPVISPGDSITICMNDSTTQHINVVDEDVATISVTASSNNALLIPDSNIFVNGAGSLWDIKIVPLPNVTGIAGITVTATDSLNQKDSTTFNISVVNCDTLPSGINKYDFRLMEVFPNPASDHVFLTYEGNANGIRIEGYTLMGERMTLPFKKLEGKLEVDTRELASGMYIICILSTKAEIIRRKIIVE